MTEMALLFSFFTDLFFHTTSFYRSCISKENFRIEVVNVLGALYFGLTLLAFFAGKEAFEKAFKNDGTKKIMKFMPIFLVFLWAGVLFLDASTVIAAVGVTGSYLLIFFQK